MKKLVSPAQRVKEQQRPLHQDAHSATRRPCTCCTSLRTRGTYRDALEGKGTFAMRQEFFDMLHLHDSYPPSSPCQRAYSLIRFLTKFHGHITSVRACSYRRLHCLAIWKIQEYVIALTTEFEGVNLKTFCSCVWPHTQPPRIHIPLPFVTKLQCLLEMYAREPEWLLDIRRTLTHVLQCEDVVTYILSFAFLLPPTVDVVNRLSYP